MGQFAGNDSFSVLVSWRFFLSAFYNVNACFVFALRDYMFPSRASVSRIDGAEVTCWGSSGVRKCPSSSIEELIGMLGTQDFSYMRLIKGQAVLHVGGTKSQLIVFYNNDYRNRKTWKMVSRKDRELERFRLELGFLTAISVTKNLVLTKSKVRSVVRDFVDTGTAEKSLHSFVLRKAGRPSRLFDVSAARLPVIDSDMSSFEIEATRKEGGVPDGYEISVFDEKKRNSIIRVLSRQAC